MTAKPLLFVHQQAPPRAAADNSPLGSNSRRQPAAEPEFEGEDLDRLVNDPLKKIIALAADCQDYEDFNAKALALLDGGSLNLDALGEDLAGQMFLATLKGVSADG